MTDVRVGFGRLMTTRRDELSQLSSDLDGVATIDELTKAGVSRSTRRSQAHSGRWRPVPGKGMILHTGPLVGEQAWRAALLRVGPGARLGGITALRADGLTGFRESRTQVWIPKSYHKDRRELSDDIWLHETRRWTAADCVGAGIPHSSVAVATIQAALWAVSRRQSALCLVMPVQQRLVRAEDVAAQLDRVKRHEFRQVLLAVMGDLLLGVHSLNELDFAVECRRRKFPEPSRQVRRTLPSGLVVLDVWWDQFNVCVEVNGTGHDQLDVAMRDEVRLADLQAGGAIALPLSILTLRVEPEPFFESLRRVLRSRGWAG